MATWKHIVTTILIIYIFPGPTDIPTKIFLANLFGISVLKFVLITYPLAIWLLWELNQHNKVGIKIKYYYYRYKPLVIIGIILILMYLFKSVKKEFGGII